MTTKNGEIVFVDTYGNPLIGQTFKIPKLRVRKDWYEGLDTADVDAFYSLKENQANSDEDSNDDSDNEGYNNEEGYADWLQQQKVRSHPKIF